MATPLRILYVEDVDDDATLIAAHLRRAGYEPVVERVETAPAMAAALAAGSWDLVLSDFSLPHFSAPDALTVLHDSGQDLPFIIISGTIQEEAAVTALRAGAHDFIVKDRLARLVPAITRELRDAGERRQAEVTRAQLAAIVESSADAIIGKTLDGIITSWNAGAERLYGYSAAEAIGQPIGILAPPDSPSEIPGILERLRRGERVENYETVRVRKDGRRLDVSVTVSPMYGAFGKIAGASSIAHDITERNNSADALRRSEERFAKAFRASPAALSMTRLADGFFVDVNDQFLILMGYTRDEVIGHTSTELNMFPTPANRAEPVGRLRAKGTVRNFEMTLLTKSGEPRSVIFSTEQIELGGEPHALAILIDNTDRKRAEDQVRESAARLLVLAQASRAFAEAGLEYQALLDQIARQVTDALGDNCMIFLLSEDGEWLNLAAIYSPDTESADFMRAIAGKPVRVADRQPAVQVLRSGQPLLVPVIDPEQLRASLKPEYWSAVERFGYRSAILVALRSQGKSIGTLSLARYRRERPAFTEQDASLAQDLADRAALAITNAHLYSERTRAEAELAGERNLLRTLIDNIPDFIFAKDMASRFILANQASAASLGQTPANVVGRTDDDFHPPEQAAQFFADEQAVMEAGQPLLDREERVFIEGQEHWLLTSTVPLRDNAGHVSGLVGISRDITERRKAEATLQHRLAELEAINRVSAALRTARALEDTLPQLLAETVAVLGGSAGSVWLYDAASDEVRLAYEQSWGRQVLPFKRGEGVPGHVVATGEPYLSIDLKNDPRMPESVRAFIPEGRGGACVPLRHEADIIGVLYVNADLPRQFSSDDVRLLTILAEIAGGAIHRMQLQGQTEQRLSQLSALRTIDQAISSSFDLDMTLAVILDQVTQQLQVDAATVLLVDKSDNKLAYAAGRGFRTAAIRRSRLGLGEGAAGQAGLERRLVQVKDIRAEGSGFLRNALLAGEGFVSYSAAPLIAKGKLQGVLEIFHREPLAHDGDWLRFLEALSGQAAIAIDSGQLFDGLQRSNADLQMAYDATIEGWSRALDLRDRETEGHSQRVTEVTEQLALNMGLHEVDLLHVRRGALLHDIGKMGVPDHILHKPGPLTDEEWVIMRRHPAFAYEMLAPIAYLRPALDIPYCHHERWDGGGYPRGLKGEQIPLAARIFAVVDVWDALRSDRPYRRAWPAEKVGGYIRDQAGSHFELAVANAFLALDFVDKR